MNKDQIKEQIKNIIAELDKMEYPETDREWRSCKNKAQSAADRIFDLLPYDMSQKDEAWKKAIDIAWAKYSDSFCRWDYIARQLASDYFDRIGG